LCGLQALLYAIVLAGLFIVVVDVFIVGLFCVSRSFIVFVGVFCVSMPLYRVSRSLFLPDWVYCLQSLFYGPGAPGGNWCAVHVT
jgi:hypothetical protein